MAAPKTITVYIDYKSPYAYLAMDGTYGLEGDFDVAIDCLPYTLEIPLYLGTVEERNEHQWRRVRYSYMDCRRMANERGLTVYGPEKLFDSTFSHVGLLYARRQGKARRYSDIVFERFFKRALNIEDRDVVRGVLDEAGVDTADFFRFLDGDGLREYRDVLSAAEEAGVFGVPMYVIDGELFWGGDRLPQVRRRLEEFGLKRGEAVTDG